jgi:hypothetical protein
LTADPESLIVGAPAGNGAAVTTRDQNLGRVRAAASLAKGARAQPVAFPAGNVLCGAGREGPYPPEVWCRAPGIPYLNLRTTGPDQHDAALTRDAPAYNRLDDLFEGRNALAH